MEILSISRVSFLLISMLIIVISGIAIWIFLSKKAKATPIPASSS